MQQVDVINAALGALGNEPLIDLTPAVLGTSVAAQKLMRSIETSRRTVLARHGWLCALEYATLPPASLTGYANWRYPSVYLAPGNCLRVWEVAGELDPLGDGPAPRWELGTWEQEAAARIVIRVTEDWGAAVTDNAGNLNISYVRLANWAALSDHVADAIAYDCAARQCASITGDKPLAQKLAETAEQRVQMAIGVDGTQSGGQPPLAGSIPAAIRAFAGNVGSWGDSYNFGWRGW